MSREIYRLILWQTDAGTDQEHWGLMIVEENDDDSNTIYHGRVVQAAYPSKYKGTAKLEANATSKDRQFKFDTVKDGNRVMTITRWTSKRTADSAFEMMKGVQVEYEHPIENCADFVLKVIGMLCRMEDWGGLPFVRKEEWDEVREFYERVKDDLRNRTERTLKGGFEELRGKSE